MTTALSRQQMREGAWAQHMLVRNGFRVEHLSPLDVYDAFVMAQRSAAHLERYQVEQREMAASRHPMALSAVRMIRATAIAGGLASEAERITGPGTSDLLGERQVLPAPILLSRAALNVPGALRVEVRTTQSPEDAADMRVSVDLKLRLQLDDGRWVGPDYTELKPYLPVDPTDLKSWLSDAMVASYWQDQKMVNGDFVLQQGDEFHDEAQVRGLLASGGLKAARSAEPAPIEPRMH